LTTKERKKIIQNISDYDEITINGKVVDESEIPAYVLEQIRGRSDIVYNQIKNNE
jgi:precorrin-6B methylase 2